MLFVGLAAGTYSRSSWRPRCWPTLKEREPRSGAAQAGAGPAGRRGARPTAAAAARGPVASARRAGGARARRRPSVAVAEREVRRPQPRRRRAGRVAGVGAPSRRAATDAPRPGAASRSGPAEAGVSARPARSAGDRSPAELPVDELIAEIAVDVPDFPEPGVVFNDLTPLFADAGAFRRVVDALTVPPTSDPRSPRR